jgi:hypothetical protein
VTRGGGSKAVAFGLRLALIFASARDGVLEADVLHGLGELLDRLSIDRTPILRDVDLRKPHGVTVVDHMTPEDAREASWITAAPPQAVIRLLRERL